MFINITPKDERWYNLEDLPNEEWRDIKDSGRSKSYFYKCLHNSLPIGGFGYTYENNYNKYD